MTVQTAAGCKLHFGTTTAASTQLEYDGDTYDEVGEIEDLGEFGDTASEITFTALGDRRVRKFKGSYDAGTITLTLGRDPTDDVGQAAIRAAMATDSEHNCKIELNDMPDGGTSPTTFYFRARVMSYTANIGSVETIVRATVGLGINTEILEVPAA